MIGSLIFSSCIGWTSPPPFSSRLLFCLFFSLSNSKRWFHSEMTCTPHTWDTLWIFDLASITSNTHDNFFNSHIFHILEPLPYKSSNKIIITCNSIYHMVPSLLNDYWDCSNLVCLINLTLIRWVWSNFLYRLFLMIHCVYHKLIKMFAHQINEFDFLCYQPNAYSTCET